MASGFSEAAMISAACFHVVEPKPTRVLAGRPKVNKKKKTNKTKKKDQKAVSRAEE